MDFWLFLNSVGSSGGKLLFARVVERISVEERVWTRFTSKEGIVSFQTFVHKLSSSEIFLEALKELFSNLQEEEKFCKALSFLKQGNKNVDFLARWPEEKGILECRGAKEVRGLFGTGPQKKNKRNNNFYSHATKLD